MSAPYTYPATLTPEDEGVGFVVTFTDIPEAITGDDTLEESLIQAVDCLETALAFRMRDGADIPKASRRSGDQHAVSINALLAAKLALYEAMRDQKVSKSELARRLDVNEKSIRLMLAPYRATRIDHLDRALKALGLRLVVSTQKAA